MLNFTRHRYELLLTAAFIVVCLMIDLRAETHLDIDSHRYLELGQSFLQTGEFSYKGINGEPVLDTSRTPVYPVLISTALRLSGGQPDPAIMLMLWLQRLAWVGAVCWLLPSIHSASGHLRRYTLLGKIALLFSPVVLYHGALLLTDLLYAAGLLAGMKLTISKLGSGRFWNGTSAGIVHGLLTLLRPFHLFIPVVAILPWLRKSPKVSVVIVGIALAISCCWIARNHSITHSWALTTLGGRALSLHQEKSIRQMQPSDSSVQLGPEFISALHSTSENSITAAWILIRDFGIEDQEADHIAGRVAMEAIVQNPLFYATQTFRNLTRYFWSRVDGYNLVQIVSPQSGEHLRSVAGWANGVWGVLMFLVLPARLLIFQVPTRIKKSRITISCLFVAAYVLLVPALTTVTYGRFTLPLLPFIGYVYCAADIGRLRRKEISAAISKRKTQ